MYSPIVFQFIARVFVLSATTQYSYGNSIPVVIDAFFHPASRWTENDRTSIAAGIFIPRQTERADATNADPLLPPANLVRRSTNG
jgi:hypothetical protein